ncbi:MAG: hypothetical protein OJF50_001247 [Nitrospira sp.]|nr:hypothetical protein [Nitrospira sp.]
MGHTELRMRYIQLAEMQLPMSLRGRILNQTMTSYRID